MGDPSTIVASSHPEQQEMAADAQPIYLDSDENCEKLGLRGIREERKPLI
jgi:hypothetical protein